MENSRIVKGWVLGLLAGFTAIALGCSIYLNEYSILLNGLVGLIIFLAACIVIQGGLGIFFLPLFWLLDKFTRKKGS